MVLWISSIGTVIAIGLYYFPLEYKNIGFWETLYFTLRLFVFEHDLANFPKLWPLVFIYFFAPVITISAVGTVITYLFRISPVLRIRWMSNHVLICGVGRTGKLFASGDDLENLEGAVSAYEWLQTDEGPVRLIWTQITNERLADVARASVRTTGKVGIRFFDT